jgi:hypothetical protein
VLSHFSAGGAGLLEQFWISAKYDEIVRQTWRMEY